MPNSRSNFDSKKDKILIQTNILNAANKNKKEARTLDKYYQYLNKKLSMSFYQIEKENFKCKSFLSDVTSRREVRLDVDQINSKNYFALMSSKKFDETNTFLPVLIKNLNDQATNSMRSFGDMIGYKLGEKLLHEETPRNCDDYLESIRTVSFNDFSTSVFKFSNGNRCLTAFPASSSKPKLKQRCKTSHPKYETSRSFYDETFNAESMSSFKSVRRDKRDAHLVNNLRDSKINFLQHFNKNFEAYNNVCSKRCLFTC